MFERFVEICHQYILRAIKLLNIDPNAHRSLVLRRLPLTQVVLATQLSQIS
jgi:hypothetical protein